MLKLSCHRKLSIYRYRFLSRNLCHFKVYVFFLEEVFKNFQQNYKRISFSLERVGTEDKPVVTMKDLI